MAGPAGLPGSVLSVSLTDGLFSDSIVCSMFSDLPDWHAAQSADCALRAFLCNVKNYEAMTAARAW